MMWVNKCLGLIIVAVFASACASPAEVKNMTVAPVSLSTASGSPFSHNLRIANVSGGKDTNPMWTSQVSGTAYELALQNSLEANNLIQKSNPDPKFEVHARLSKLDQPFFGLDMTVTSKVGYEVIETKTRKSWFDKEILASYTAKFRDAPIGLVRLRLANEGSIRENIKKFINELFNTHSQTALKTKAK